MTIGALLKSLDPEKLQKFFFSSQILVVAIILGGIYFLTRKREESSFKVREADLVKPKIKSSGPDLLAGATVKKKEAPLKLAGIRIDGLPHEILGVSARATEAEIQSAFRELMKTYHPDKVGRPGSREWNDAQKIAEALNQARKTMIDQIQSQNPNRSGR